MKETTRIADQLQRAYAGGAWHGPSVRYNLRAVTARQAALRPIRNAHSIWELVLHLTVWTRVVRKRLADGTSTHLPPAKDFPRVTDTSERAWKAALAQLDREHAALIRVIRKFPESRLNRKLGGGDYSYYITMHGAVQHDLYHAGQIAILKKLVRRKRSR